MSTFPSTKPNALELSNTDIVPLELFVWEGIVTKIREYFGIPSTILLFGTNKNNALRVYTAQLNAAGSKQIQTEPIKINYPIIILSPTSMSVRDTGYSPYRLARLGILGKGTEEYAGSINKHSIVPINFNIDLTYSDNMQDRMRLFSNRWLMGSVKPGTLNFNVVYDNVNFSVRTILDSSLSTATEADDKTGFEQNVSFVVEGYISDFGKHINQTYYIDKINSSVKL